MIISENDLQPCNCFQTSVTNLDNSPNISVISEKIDILNDHEAVTKIFKSFGNKVINTTYFTKEQKNLVIKFLILSVDELTGNENAAIQLLSVDELTDNENAAIQQSKCDHWFLKRIQYLTVIILAKL